MPSYLFVEEPLVVAIEQINGSGVGFVANVCNGVNGAILPRFGVSDCPLIASRTVTAKIPG